MKHGAQRASAGRARGSHLLLALLLSLPPLPLRAAPAGEAPAAPAGDPASRPRVALVLQGGGAMGLAHVGVLKLIDQLGIPVDIVVGTSMGSIVGGLYSIGYGAEELERLTLGADWLELFFAKSLPADEKYWDRLDRSRYAISLDFDRSGTKLSAGLLSDRRILAYLDRLTLSVPAEADFDSLPRRFRAVATDIATGERVVLGRGSLADAMRASMGIPGVFAPYRLGGRYLVDGGLVDNLPIDLARELGAEIVIAVQLSGGERFSEEELGRSPLASLTRSIDIMTDMNVLPQLPRASYVLNVDLTGYTTADFLRGAEILAVGERAALERRGDFEELRSRILGPGGAAAEAPPRPAPPRVDRVLVVGAEGKEEAKTLSLLLPLEGGLADEAVLEEAVGYLERRGAYSSIRLQSEERGRQSLLVLRLQKSPPERNAVRLGFASEASYTTSIGSRDIIAPGLVFRGLTSPGSKLTIDFSLNDQPGLGAAFLQPLGERLFAELSFLASSSVDTYVTDDLEGRSFQINRQSVAWRLGFTPFNWAEIAASLRYDEIPHTGSYPDLPAGPDVEAAPIASLSFELSLLDSPIFPQKGVHAAAGYQQGIPGIGGSRAFRTFETSGCLVSSIDVPLSLELEWEYGTDFSERGDDDDAAPAYYKPDLANRRMFPGLMDAGERMGGHVLGLSLLGKYQLNWSTRALGLPAFALLHGSAGTALQDLAQAGSFKDYSHATADIGLGLRVNDAFGLMMRVGMARGLDEVPKGFVAIDLGAFGMR